MTNAGPGSEPKQRRLTDRHNARMTKAAVYWVLQTKYQGNQGNR